MISTPFAKAVLRGRREYRDMIKAGWLPLVEGDCRLLMELARGNRVGKRIIEAKPSGNGKAVWVKLA